LAGSSTPADDQAVQIQLNLAKSNVTTHSATYTVAATTGNFEFGFASNGKTTAAIAIGASASVVQSALTQLLSDSGLTGTVSVTQSGNAYTVTFSAVDLTCPSGQCLNAGVLLVGNVQHTHEGTQADFDAALQSAIRSVLKAAGVAGSDSPTVTGSGVSAGASGPTFVLSFPSPIVATAGGGRVSLTAPQVTYTFDDNQPVVSVGRHVAVDVASYGDASFQQLGLGTLPVRLDYTGFTFTPIEFTLFINGAQL